MFDGVKPSNSESVTLLSDLKEIKERWGKNKSYLVKNGSFNSAYFQRLEYY